LKQPTTLDNHPNKTILASILPLMKIRTQPLSLYKVPAHSNIEGNIKVNKLAKVGNELSHPPHIPIFEHAHYIHLLMKIFLVPYNTKAMFRTFPKFTKTHYDKIQLRNTSQFLPTYTKMDN
jgi:hypothetical protein